ncbi:MAG: cell division protein ZapB [Thermoanaerobaculia bacterium]|nr:cell division protein ZapB [Thermoanaerobaculia bacterium]
MEAPWLNQLEDRVRQAIKEIERLREENASLDEEVKTLRKAASKSASVTATSSKGKSKDSERWEAERIEVKERVEALAVKLEKLLNKG